MRRLAVPAERRGDRRRHRGDQVALAALADRYRREFTCCRTNEGQTCSSG
jgi:hypothetical protein